MNPDPVRPSETDEEPWTVALPPADPALLGERPTVLRIPLILALVVIVGVLVLWAAR